MANYNEIVRRYEKATEDVREAVEELRLASIAFGYEDGRKDARLREISETVITPEMQAKLWQKKRDEIVAKAKADLAELKDWEGAYPYREEDSLTYGCRAEYIINKEKRTVVVLLRGASTKKVRSKGIAKCDPSDCFNVHIGKAIALRRAMGIDVPSEYLNAPQPTAVRVGDVVRGKYAGSNLRYYTDVVANITDEDYEYMSGSFDEIAETTLTIIDDSRE